MRLQSVLSAPNEINPFPSLPKCSGISRFHNYHRVWCLGASSWRLDSSNESSDLYHLYFFFPGHLKSLVYETSVETPEDLIARIVTTSTGIQETPVSFERVSQSFLRASLFPTQ
ncbi:hypothetical protein AVEN_121795-1 [Araneus ventricosus]|uniref:Uncharacterized protein n=1 Tax=Araneus ventricosus TaxID=182803 RepID=A0A4Y2I8B7_ARAVE|nr:hypothetical protein AVEN_121795-1 [Araneus ventricosus]